MWGKCIFISLVNWRDFLFASEVCVAQPATLGIGYNFIKFYL